MPTTESDTGIFEALKTRSDKTALTPPLFFAILALEDPAQMRTYLREAAESEYIAREVAYLKRFYGRLTNPETRVGDTIIDFLYTESPYSRAQYWEQRYLHDQSPHLCDTDKLQALKAEAASWNNRARIWAHALAEVFPEYNTGANSTNVTNEPVLDPRQFPRISSGTPPVDFSDVYRRNGRAYFGFLLSN